MGCSSIRKVRLSFFMQLSEKELVFFSVCADFPQSFCQCANGCFRQASCLLGTYADAAHAGYTKVFVSCFRVVFWNGTHRTVCHAFAAALAGIGYHWHQTTAMTFQIRSVTGQFRTFGCSGQFFCDFFAKCLKLCLIFCIWSACPKLVHNGMLCNSGNTCHYHKPLGFQSILQFRKSIVKSTVTIGNNSHCRCAIAMKVFDPFQGCQRYSAPKGRYAAK